jgi:hypothetical protein
MAVSPRRIPCHAYCVRPAASTVMAITKMVFRMGRIASNIAKLPGLLPKSSVDNGKTATNGAEIWAACEVHNQTRGDSVMPLSTLLPLILLALIGIAAFYALYRAGV